jgi:hypothetical protein
MEGYIEKQGVKVCNKIYGSYMGYIDFDGERYFDLRDQEALEVIDIPLNSTKPLCLESDSRKRIDLVELFSGDPDVAQQNKNTLEVI